MARIKKVSHSVNFDEDVYEYKGHYYVEHYFNDLSEVQAEYMEFNIGWAESGLGEPSIEHIDKVFKGMDWAHEISKMKKDFNEDEWHVYKYFQHKQ